MLPNPYENNPKHQEVYHCTEIVRKPLSGIVSGYHELPYILIAPEENEESKTVRIDGTIKVSPKFIISAQQLGEAFGEVFDPQTFSDDLEGRIFSFIFRRQRNVKLHSEHFRITQFDGAARDHLDRAHNELARREDVTTALIFGPRFDYYPISIDKFVNEVLDREFRI